MHSSEALKKGCNALNSEEAEERWTHRVMNGFTPMKSRAQKTVARKVVDRESESPRRPNQSLPTYNCKQELGVGVLHRQAESKPCCKPITIVESRITGDQIFRGGVEPGQ